MEKDDIKNLFTFSKSERRGAFVLSIAILIVLLYNIFSPVFFQEEYDFSSFHKEIDSLKNKQTSINVFPKETVANIPSKIEKAKLPRLYNFNPNTTTEKEWISMGLSPKQAKSICKYIRKGGKFYTKEDLRKMYCLNSEECNRLIPFVVIDELEDQQDIGIDFGNLKIIDTVKIELNAASFENLMEIKGIGPATAKGILKYKSILGGYVDKKQLREVYQIDSSRYKQISGYFTISLDSVRKINLNTSSYFELKKHPYISKSLAYEITQYRSMKGDYNSVEDLKKIKNLSDSLYQKIYLYFAVSEK